MKMREPETGAALERLEHQYGIATRFWGRMFSALTAITFREKGEAALHRLWHDVLVDHQGERYHEGMVKLGIDKDPPAIAAARYHYYTNLIGGLEMDYAEESQRKAWVRYKAPMWTSDGVAMLCLPAALRRTILGSWHPRNGLMMGCPRLGWVATKFIMQGDPYDEGYFFEYDHDLAPEERYRFEHVASSPPHDAERAPTLDPKEWPPARLVRARRNFSSRYLLTTVQVLLRHFGEEPTWYLVQQTARGMAIQYAHDLAARLGVHGTSARDVASVLAGLLACCSQDHAREDLSEGRQRIVVSSFKPFEDDAPQGLREAMFHFQAMTTRLLNGHLRITRTAHGAAREVWEIEDAGRWLW
jgi:hypothetical protein